MEPGDLLAYRSLRPLTTGEAVGVGGNLRRAQVLVLPHSEPCAACAAYLALLHEAAERIEGENVDVVALVTPLWEELASSIPLPALIDDGVISSRLSRLHEPVVAIVDRFGQLFARFDAGDDHLFPAPEQILTCLLGIGIGCPECGVPDVPGGSVLPEWDARSGGMRILQ
ncbi:MAG TPA: hypothetical protein VGV93_09935 [Acidimicrobiales bacterium]|nr:hypothetical protein [Acidimicrobiales bacterium]